MQQTTGQTLLDAAERRIRVAGYNGFSFRDLANDVGIKSASVHHHFATKEVLVRRLTDRYAERFRASLPTGPRGTIRISDYREAFRRALDDGGAICLCGMLGAEGAGLPDSVNAGAAAFFVAALDDLATHLDGHVPNPKHTALAVLAQLEGAHILARTLQSLQVFDDATAHLTQTTKSPVHTH